MPAPAVMSGVPPGLEYLSQVDQLLVNQQIELLEGGSFCCAVIVRVACVCVRSCVTSWEGQQPPKQVPQDMHVQGLQPGWLQAQGVVPP